MFHSQIGSRKKNGPKLSNWEQSVPFTDRNSEQNSRPKFGPIWEQTVIHSWKYEKKAVLNYQFGNNMPVPFTDEN